MIKKAVKTAEKAKLVIAVVGESRRMTGEASCRANLDLPGVQNKLLQELYKTGKPIIAVLANGRPLVLTWMNKHIPAILETWFSGTQGGNAVADVLFGDQPFAGKLPYSWPRSLEQIPFQADAEPLFPCGYGLN